MKRSRFELGLTVESHVSGHVLDAKRQFVTGDYENASHSPVNRPLVERYFSPNRSESLFTG